MGNSELPNALAFRRNVVAQANEPEDTASSLHAEDSDKERAKHWTSMSHHAHTLASLQGKPLLPQLVLL